MSTSPDSLRTLEGIIIHVGGYHEYTGNVQSVRVFNIN